MTVYVQKTSYQNNNLNNENQNSIYNILYFTKKKLINGSVQRFYSIYIRIIEIPIIVLFQKQHELTDIFTYFNVGKKLEFCLSCRKQAHAFV